ncbi:tyrosine-type recombinase/integrase, partial [Candidatus Nomurabacteria bacterium]|nr:tyrosine-type recombinase/integrase [Candidatus Nomurabacteria bacterium]
AFIKWCASKGWYEGSISIKYKENEGAILFLTQEEFTKLENAKFSLPALERMRDVFIFGTMTGLRYGDIKGLKKNDFRDGRIWYYEQKKQATIERNIKLVPKALAVVQKYMDLPGDQLLPVYSDPNRLLKDLFVAAKIERQVTIVRKYAGGRIEETIVPLSQVAHSHMGRKTFITFGLTMGIPEVVLKSITGHSKDSDSFRRYYNIIDSMKDDALDATFGKL